MGPYALRRILDAVPVVFVVSVLIFAGLRCAPGDPAEIMAGPDPGPETIAAIRQAMGLDLPIAAQYALWLRAAVTGDLGLSLANGLPVGELLLDRMGPTLQLAAAGMAMSLAIGISLGLVAGLNPHSLADRAVSGFASLGLATPKFWTGILLILVFGLELRLFPVAGRADFSDDPIEAMRSLFLPALTLGLGNGPIIARFLRSGVIETRKSDHVRTAIAKGLPWPAIVRGYILRNSLIPVVTVAGLMLGNLVGGTALVEIVFSWPGLGSLLVNAIGNRDYSVVQGVMLLVVAGFLASSIAVDILYGLLDPRIRHGQRR
jgi:peptide/nickel transport system permease protein